MGCVFDGLVGALDGEDADFGSLLRREGVIDFGGNCGDGGSDIGGLLFFDFLDVKVFKVKNYDAIDFLVGEVIEAHIALAEHICLNERATT